MHNSSSSSYRLRRYSRYRRFRRFRYAKVTCFSHFLLCFSYCLCLCVFFFFSGLFGYLFIGSVWSGRLGVLYVRYGICQEDITKREVVSSCRAEPRPPQFPPSTCFCRIFFTLFFVFVFLLSLFFSLWPGYWIRMFWAPGSLV